MELSFFLTRGVAGKDTGIYAHIRYNKNRMKYYLSERIDPEFWDYKQQRVKKTTRFPRHVEMNRRLSKVSDQIKDIYSAYRNDNGNADPSPATLKALLDDAFKTAALKTKSSFITFFEEIKETSLSGTRVQVKDGNPFTKGTVKAYTTAINHLKAYEQAKKRKLQFEDITVDFHADFTEFLIIKYKLSANSIGKDIKNIKMVMNEGAERNLHQNRQFKSKRFGVTKEDSFSIYLTLEELEAIMELDLADSPARDRVRDLFIAGCYTGLRFSDLSILKPDQIENGYIEITQTKTGDPVVIPVHPVLQGILDKYEGKMPGAISNQKTNDYLKDIGEAVAKNEQKRNNSCTLDAIVHKTITKGGTKVTTAVKKWELLSTHTARRSFATNEYKAGTPSLTIMHITGHKTEKAFMKYIKLTPKEHAMKMKTLWADRNQLKAV